MLRRKRAQTGYGSSGSWPWENDKSATFLPLILIATADEVIE